jgi:hypothetical protein
MKSAITISIDKGLLRACRSAAFAARRTLSSQIEQWIDEKLALDAALPSSSPALSASTSESNDAPASTSGKTRSRKIREVGS